LPLLQTWLRTADVVRWWGDPEEQAALLLSDLDEPRMVMEIVSFEGRPFAYAQNLCRTRVAAAAFRSSASGVARHRRFGFQVSSASGRFEVVRRHRWIVSSARHNQCTD
jgi:hypothetical protein